MNALGWVATLSLPLIGLAVTPGLIDRYRVIKESLSRAEGIIGLFLIVIAVSYAGSERLREMLRERAVAAVLAAGVFWAVLTTLLSTHHGHSIDALATFLGCVLVFVFVWYAAPKISLLILDLLVPVVLINTTLAAMQEYMFYQPFDSHPDMPRHLQATGLIGNPNIVGSYMVLATIIFAAAAIHVHGWRKWLYIVGALGATTGVLVSETRTAVIALVAGLLLLAIGRSIKRALAIGAALVVLFVTAYALRVKVVREVLELPRVVRIAGIEKVSSGRITPILTALEMTRDRPLTGMGPGTYPYHYMPYKVRTTENYRFRSIVNMNFGEAHNDHVQLLAETGIPGYLLFLAAVLILVRAVRRTSSDDPRALVARRMIVPLAGTLLILCLAQFPLYVPITRHLMVTMAGLLIGWSRLSELSVVGVRPQPNLTRIAIGCVAAGIGGWLMFHFVYRPHRCNAQISELTARTDATSQTSSDYGRLQRARRNLDDLARLREECPTSVRVPMLMGANQELIGRVEDAERSYREALTIEQRPEIYMALALAQVQLGRVDDAVENYTSAVRFGPQIIDELPSDELTRRVQERLGQR